MNKVIRSNSCGLCLFTSITLAFAFTFQIHAQSKVSSVYLKNGSIIKGSVTESSDTSQVKIQSENGSVIFASKDDILRIEQDDITVNKMFLIMGP